MNCHEATRVLSEAQDRPLRFTERCALRVHLLYCRGCRRFRRQLDFLRRACRTFPWQ